MKASEADILMIPGPGNDDPSHWLVRWKAKLLTARLVSDSSWDLQGRDDQPGATLSAIEAAERPVILVAHSTGIISAILAAPLARNRIAGAFLVSPPELEGDRPLARQLRRLGAYPREPLAFPSVVVASRNDPHGSFDHAGDLANAWGSLFIDAGESGHIDPHSGHGPWPEGSMVFARFVARLTP
jgi:predicted alpha/beta hydrolase family esterase